MSDYVKTTHIPDRLGLRKYPDGSAVYPSGLPGKWLAKWADGTPLTGCDEATGMETTWHFPSADEASQALADGGEGPAAATNGRCATC